MEVGSSSIAMWWYCSVDYQGIDSIYEADRRKEASKNAYTNYMKYQKKLKKEDEVQYLPDFEPLE